MKKLVLFGAGQQGENLYGFLEYYHYEGLVYAFCDNNPNKWGGNLFGKDIISVGELRNLEDAVCLICVSNQYKDEIERQLKQENIFYYGDIIDCFSIEFGIEKSQFENFYYSYFNRKKGLKIYEVNEEYIRAQRLIDKSKNMIDLGCGTSPHSKAKVAVDKFIEPLHRKYGQNKSVDIASIENRGIKFVETDIENLPFGDNEFDVAYSHHVIEHLDDPRNGLNEMMRIATAGVIMCPSIFSEYAFGRKYHKWMVTAQNNTLIFIEKDWENLWFGDGPQIKDGRMHFNADVNPFDVLLNDGDWYHGEEQYKRLTEQMRKYWYGHYKNMETCFVWENDFDYLIIYKNGDFYSSKGGI